MFTRSNVRRAVVSFLCAGLLLAGFLVTPTGGATDAKISTFSSFVKPAPIHSMANDPWLGGVWLGTGVGLFFKPLDAEGLLSYAARSGLPGTNIRDIAATPEVVWVGTDWGPAAFYKANSTALPFKLADGRVLHALTYQILVEGDTIWIGTHGEGLFKADRVSRIAQPVPNPYNGTAFRHAVAGLDADGSMMFISATGYGLVSWDRSTGKAQRHKAYTWDTGPNYGKILATSTDVWVTTVNDGVFRYDRATWTAAQYNSPHNIGGLLVFDAHRVGRDIWFNHHTGVSRYTPSTDTWREYSTATGFDWGAAHAIGFADGELYASTSSTKMMKYDRVADRWDPIDWWEHRVPFWNTVTDCDRDGSHFLFSTGGGGANDFDPATGLWFRIEPAQGYSGRPADILIYSSVVESFGVWFATHKGLSHWDRASDTWELHRTDQYEENDVRKNPVVDIEVTPSHVYTVTTSYAHPAYEREWLGEKLNVKPKYFWTDGHLGILDRATGTWETYNTTTGLLSGNLSSVAVTPGKVWIGTLGAGLQVLDLETKEFTKVYPANDTLEGIFSLSAHDGTLWAGAIRQGLVRVDPDTLDARPVPGFFKKPVKSITWNDGVLWLGTAGYGVIRYDPSSGNLREYHVSQPFDAFAHCVLPDGNILYVGTARGVERLDMTTGAWLPQVIGIGSLASDPVIDPALEISTPTPGAAIPSAEMLDVVGTAAGPSGSRIQVRLGTGAWYPATGLSDWTISVPIDEDILGPATLTVRLRAGDQTLAQAARDIVITAGADSPAAQDQPVLQPRFSHVPVLEVDTETPAEVTVRTAPAPEGLQGTLFVKPPGATQFQEIPLALADGDTLSGSIPAFGDPGMAEYYILVRWTDGATRLPELQTGFGSVYRTVVRPLQGQASTLVLAREAEVAVEPGSSAIVVFTVQNTGARPADMQLQLSGPAAAWADAVAPSVRLTPAQALVLGLNVTAPAGTADGVYALELTAAPDSAHGTGSSGVVNVRIGDVGIVGDGNPEPRPAPPLPAILGLAIVAAVAFALQRARRKHI